MSEEKLPCKVCRINGWTIERKSEVDNLRAEIERLREERDQIIEQCVRLCMAEAERWGEGSRERYAAMLCANAIRARKEASGD